MFWRKKVDEDNINLIEEISHLKEVVNRQSILIEDLVKENKRLLKNYEKTYDNIGKLTNILEDNSEHVKNKSETKTYRKYPQSVIKMIPSIIQVRKDGTLLTKGKQIASYTIYDLQKLVKYIPNKQDYPTWNSLSEKIGINVNTLQRLCAGIELDYYTNIFHEWQKIQNTITKPDVVYVNNPEKRKELGMGGY